ncbi:MAG: YfhO family protein [Candidatus Gottesmanbacteria bacterium]
MKRLFSRLEILIILICACIAVGVFFRPYFFQKKILFPSNLLVTAFVPWRYEPVPEYPNGPPNKPIAFDDIRQFFPNRKLLHEELAKRIIPLWNPYIYSGTPFMGAFDTAVWYPLSLIAALLPVIEGWNFLVIIQPILSILFMYLFLSSLHRKKHIALFGAFAYAFSGWMIVYWQEILVLEHSFLWLPLALYASNRIWKESKEVLGFSLLVIALVCSVFGGFLQMTIYVYGMVILWNIFCYWRLKEQKTSNLSFLRIMLLVGISVGIASIQLVPSIEAFLQSPRGTGTGNFIFKDFLLPFQHLMTFLAPDFWGSPATYNYFFTKGFYFEKMIYIGIIPLMFALYALLFEKGKNVVFWKIVALGALSLGFALPTSLLPNLLHIPVLSNSYPTRIFAISTFSFIILASYGLQSFLALPKRKLLFIVLSMLTVVLVAGWMVVGSTWCTSHSYPSNIIWCKGKISVLWDLISIPAIRKEAHLYSTVSLRNLIIPTLFLFSGWGILVLSKFFLRFVCICVFALTFFSSVYFGQKYVSFSERRFVYPDLNVTNKISEIIGYDRVWGYGNAFIEKNLPQYYRWFSTDGYGNLSSKRYAEFITTIANKGKLGGVIRRSDTDLYDASERDDFGYSNPYRLRIMSLLGVKYVLETKKGDLKDFQRTEKRFPADTFVLVWEDDIWRIWEYKKVLPRAFFATTYVVAKNDQEIMDRIYDPTTDLESTVILENEPINGTVSLDTKDIMKSDVGITSYGVNKVTMTVDAKQDGFVVLTDTYYPGWCAYIDGKKTQIYRADYTLRAVYVPKGQHKIEFVYMPQSFLIGIFTTSLGIILLCIFILNRKKVSK